MRLTPSPNSPASKAGFVILILVALACGVSATEKVLHNFAPPTGVSPEAGLIFDTAGNLYGTAQRGGGEWGTVVELSPNGDSTWTTKVIHNFASGNDGQWPDGTLVFDAAGNLYGTTSLGGPVDNGVVFECMPNGDGSWTEKVLYAFADGMDGAAPAGKLIFDAAGNLYGTTVAGGSYGIGTVFELMPDGSGVWTEKILHNFGHGEDGSYPLAGLMFDAAGNLYGTAWHGGTNNQGTVFELSPNDSGGWTEKTLHNFGSGMDGTGSKADLVFDTAGNLFGTASTGGSYGHGTVFELTPNGSGGWTERTVHNFRGGADGAYPGAGLIFDRAGNLYGTTENGGTHSGGTAFELMPDGSGGWTEKALHFFGEYYVDGLGPCGALLFDSRTAAGKLYGTTEGGGGYGWGTVFEITPDQ